MRKNDQLFGEEGKKQATTKNSRDVKQSDSDLRGI